MVTIYATLTTEPDARVCMHSTYDPPFVAALKLAIPWDGREWHAGRRRWLITALYAPALLAFLQHYGVQVTDGRTPEPAPEPGGALAPGLAMPADLQAAFDVLMVQYMAPLGVAEAAWKFLSKFYHPDKGGSGEECVLINEAIAVIRSYLHPRVPDASSHGEDDDIPF